MTITGHEEEFRRLFQQEAATRLTSLAEGAMELEARADDIGLIAAMFRDAHTLKGGAAVVGFDRLAAVVHELEQLLEELRSRRRRADGALVDGILGAVDALREIVERSMAGSEAEEAEAAARRAIAGARTGTPSIRREALRAAPAPAPEPEPSPEPVAAEPALLPAGAPSPRADSIAVPVERLDELVRLVGESAAALLRVGRVIGDDPHAQDEYRELARVLQELQEKTMRARMVSVGTVAAPLRRAVRDIARASGKEVRWELEGEETELDRHVLEQLREPLVALVRNAVDHGVEPPGDRAARGKPREALVRVHATQIGADVVIAVQDDGRGVDVDRVRHSTGRELSATGALEAIFEPGLSTAATVGEVSGRGVGLDAVRSVVDDLRGRVEVRSEPGAGAEFRISVPMTLAVVRCLLVRAGRRRYALPMHSTMSAQSAANGAVLRAEGRSVVIVDGEAVGLTALAGVLGVDGGDDHAPTAVVLATAAGRHAFAVDELVGQRDVVVKDLGRLLPRLPLVAGASVEPDGGIMLVLDPAGLIAAARGRNGLVAPVAPAPAAAPPRLLVVDDALTVRELQRSILERAGYEVETAADGDAALRALAERRADLVLCDVEMPNMDGFSLTAAIRERPDIAGTPVLILTSRDDDEDRRRGLEAGADAYLGKGSFDEQVLLAAVRRLLGEEE